MNKLEFVTPEGQEPNREEFVLFVNTGTREAPDWQPLGSGNEDSSVSFDWSTSSSTDILGNVKITAKKPSKTQDLDPLPLTVGQKAVEYLWERFLETAVPAGELESIHANEKAALKERHRPILP